MTIHCNLLLLKFMQICSTLRIVSRCKTSYICMNSNRDFPTVLLCHLLLSKAYAALRLSGNSDKELVKRLSPPSESFLDILYKHRYILGFRLLVFSALPCLDMSLLQNCNLHYNLILLLLLLYVNFVLVCYLSKIIKEVYFIYFFYFTINCIFPYIRFTHVLEAGQNLVFTPASVGP